MVPYRTANVQTYLGVTQRTLIWVFLAVILLAAIVAVTVTTHGVSSAETVHTAAQTASIGRVAFGGGCAGSLIAC